MKPFTLLATGNKTVRKVYQAPEPGPHERPRRAERDRARAAVPGRLQALREARGEPTRDPPPRPRVDRFC